MKNRPLSVVLIASLYIAAGAIGLAFHLTEFKPQHPFQYDIVWISLIRLLAVVAGVYILRGNNWARWLALAWIVCHVILSAFHSWVEFVFHSVLCAAIAYFLFRPQATRYFRGARTEAT